VRGRLTALSLLAGIIVPASGALGAPLGALPRQPMAGAGSIGIRLVDVPPDSRDPRARSYIVDRLAPGTTIRRRFEIVNTTRSTADVAVYPAAAGLRRGGFVFASGHSRNELSRWTTVTPVVLRLQPGTNAFETLTINVPKDASSGERYAVVWAEVSGSAPAKGGVTLVNRVGIRMYLSIGPGGAPPSNFGIGSLTAGRSETGQPLVSAKLRNSGQRTLDISGNLTLSKGPGGLRAGPFPVKLGTALAPGYKRLVTVPLDKRLPRGPWRAQMRLRSGLIQRVATATIKFPRHTLTAKPQTAKLAPVGYRRLILVIALLALAACALLLSRRVGRERGHFKPTATVRD
jgi:hypothetical protein